MCRASTWDHTCVARACEYRLWRGDLTRVSLRTARAEIQQELPLTDEHAWHVSPLPFPGTAEAPLRTKSATRLLRARAGHVYLGVGSISDSLSLTSARVINYLTLLDGRAAPHAIAANVS